MRLSTFCGLHRDTEHYVDGEQCPLLLRLKSDRKWQILRGSRKEVNCFDLISWRRPAWPPEDDQHMLQVHRGLPHPHVQPRYTQHAHQGRETASSRYVNRATLACSILKIRFVLGKSGWKDLILSINQSSGYIYSVPRTKCNRTSLQTLSSKGVDSK